VPIALSTISPFASAQTVWSGLTKTFTRTAFSDGALPENQDALTPNVIFTRLGSGGLVNFTSDAFYQGGISPLGTEWATAGVLGNSDKTIAATNWQNLAFTDWIDAFGGSGTTGSGIPNQPAVVHLMTDNVYLDLEFTSWEPGHGAGYTYLRAEPAALPTPTGDYNHNGVVDAADFVLWQNTLGQSASPAGGGADGNANGMIDAGDYTFWRAHFGNTVPGSGSLATAEVPEPSAMMLFFATLGGLIFPRKERRVDST
jgi:hypothetical protein